MHVQGIVSQATVQAVCTFEPTWIKCADTEFAPTSHFLSLKKTFVHREFLFLPVTFLQKCRLDVIDVSKTLQDLSSFVFKEPIRVKSKSLSGCMAEVTVEMWNVCEWDVSVCEWGLCWWLICQHPDRQGGMEMLEGYWRACGMTMTAWTICSWL